MVHSLGRSIFVFGAAGQIGPSPPHFDVSRSHKFRHTHTRQNYSE